jgi:hypothetical protein
MLALGLLTTGIARVCQRQRLIMRESVERDLQITATIVE